ncbi:MULTISPECIES: ABC transporter substrate-binding protein [unclassified Bradyrhizobium]|uniref:ABC transporter substrate-binding protein n=1 Tax=unclassified Bradyrhizobium TaxID=2631580 RepID=UPI001FF72957|nr:MULTISPECIES: ABC transporter substrate-binding protein [unclassified Bradyrhizobium]MCK1347299.1 hypothetical protein [Bradyrhizobium sp. CW11]MCK1704696.1 hypothetical protein [Bradyrhizobium sp. 146]
MERTKDVSKKDEKTFTIALKESLALLIDQIANCTSYLLFVMREKDADRPPRGRSPRILDRGQCNEVLFQPDVRYVYDRNEHYVPGHEPPGGLVGGKIVKVDRANWEAIDVQTAMAALQSGELDFVSDPLAHFYPMVESDPNLVLEDLHKLGR